MSVFYAWFWYSLFSRAILLFFIKRVNHLWSSPYVKISGIVLASDYYSASTMKLLLNLNCSSIPETLEVEQTFVTVVLSNVCSLSFQYYYTYENCNILISLLKFLTRTLKHRFQEGRISRPLKNIQHEGGGVRPNLDGS